MRRSFVKTLDRYFEAGKADAKTSATRDPRRVEFSPVPDRFRDWAYEAGWREGKDELRRLARSIKEIDS